jgi:hypothetical protein
MPALLMPLALPLHVAATVFVLVRSPDPVSRRARWAGLVEGLRGAGPFLRERRAWRARDLGAVARALAWSPAAVRTRRVVARRVSG